MSMSGHYKVTEDMDREALREELKVHMHLNDEQIDHFMNDPSRSYYAPKFGDPDKQDWTMVLEVVSTVGCASGMQVGDKLYFINNCSNLDVRRSSPRWCGQALNKVPQLVAVFHNAIMMGHDPNEGLYHHYVGCGDCGLEWGWGQCHMKAYCFRESLGEDYCDRASFTADRLAEDVKVNKAMAEKRYEDPRVKAKE